MNSPTITGFTPKVIASVVLCLGLLSSSPSAQDAVAAKWEVCSPETVSGFSAVACFFARDLQKEVHVPIGLIRAAVGGSAITSWCAPSMLEDVPELKTGLPAGVKLYWGEEPTEPLSAKRGQICLNGIWEFVPMLDRAETEPPSGMAYIHVPGSWKPSWPIPGLASERGSGPAWKNWEDGSGTWCAWYRRKIKIPAQ